MTNVPKERSVEEIVAEIINKIAGTRYYANDEKHEYGQIPGLNSTLKTTLTQTLQTERQKREEMVEDFGEHAAFIQTLLNTAPTISLGDRKRIIEAHKKALASRPNCEEVVRLERERIKKEITEQHLLNDGKDTFVNLGEALWVCDSKEDREKFLQALNPKDI